MWESGRRSGTLARWVCPLCPLCAGDVAARSRVRRPIAGWPRAGLDWLNCRTHRRSPCTRRRGAQRSALRSQPRFGPESASAQTRPSPCPPSPSPGPRHPCRSAGQISQVTWEEGGLGVPSFRARRHVRRGAARGRVSHACLATCDCCCWQGGASAGQLVSCCGVGLAGQVAGGWPAWGLGSWVSALRDPTLAPAPAGMVVLG